MMVIKGILAISSIGGQICSGAVIANKYQKDQHLNPQFHAITQDYALEVGLSRRSSDSD